MKNILHLPTIQVLYPLILFTRYNNIIINNYNYQRMRYFGWVFMKKGEKVAAKPTLVGKRKKEILGDKR